MKLEPKNDKEVLQVLLDGHVIEFFSPSISRQEVCFTFGSWTHCDILPYPTIHARQDHD